MICTRTPDEDFEILLEAAVIYDRRVAALLDENDSADEGALRKEISGWKQYFYPRLLFIITGNGSVCPRSISFLCAPFFLKFSNLHLGKGPWKEKYEETIKRLNLKHVAFRTMWLSTEDYPLLLGIIFIINFLLSSPSH